MSKVITALKEAFAGESQANRKYLAFSKKAEQDGYSGVAKLFHAAAAAETIHAHSHLKAMDGVRSTAENLQEGIDGESFEFEQMYPPMIELAKQEGNKQAERSFYFAHEAEKVHAQLYQDALDHLEEKADVAYHLCLICGYISKDEVPEKCPICGAKGETFKEY